MKFFRKNLNSNFIRICRIQCSSKQRNQNLYPDHLYRIKYILDNIYYPDRSSDIKEKFLQLYTGTNLLFFVNDNELYYKITETEDYKYIDIAVYIPTYSTNIHVDIDSVNDGSIVFFCDKANQNEYTRINYLGEDSNIMFFKSSRYIFTNSSIKLCLAKGYNRITDIRTGTTCYIIGSDLTNNNNDLFTLTIEQETTYGLLVNITAKGNNNLLIENL